jgi:hypothetical protein
MAKHPAAALLVLLTCSSALRAHDRWENPIFNSTDDNATTLNFLQHGAVQRQHDLDSSGGSAPDEDWFAVKVTEWHSYEARVNSGLTYWSQSCTPAPCPRFDWVDAAGTVLVAGQIQTDDAWISIDRASSGAQSAGRGMTVRWLPSLTGIQFVRAKSDGFITFSDNVFYDVSFRDTTYVAPRWNNSGTQVSILLLQNVASSPVGVQVSFFDATGSHLIMISYELPAFGSHVFNTSTIPTLQGRSGAIKVAHLGGYGSLAGKVVSLEPATGFTFDTALTPIPY